MHDHASYAVHAGLTLGWSGGSTVPRLPEMWGGPALSRERVVPAASSSDLEGEHQRLWGFGGVFRDLLLLFISDSERQSHWIHGLDIENLRLR